MEPSTFLIIVAIAVGVVVVVNAVRAYNTPSGPTHICPNCRSKVITSAKAPGSGVLELVLWLMFLVPGFLYTIWRTFSTRTNTCPLCKAPNPVPLDTPAGQSLSA